jgi:hypothetical protein
MEWDDSRPKGSPLTPTPKGWMARIGRKPRWICGRKPHDEALAIYHRKAAAITSGQEPMPEPTRDVDDQSAPR